jgi:glycosyltransferase involved in cell wall biosynthesis
MDLRGWPRSSQATPGLAPEGPVAFWPRVTIVTPSYNQARFLEDTILSVLNQGYPDLEYMVIDGSSTDGSLDIIRRYADRLTHWESVVDRGQSDAVNKGWRRASGKYVWWLNSDDMLMPGSLFATVGFLEGHADIDLVYGDLMRIDEQGNVIDRYCYRDFDFVEFATRQRSVAQAGSLMRRGVLERIGLLDEALHFHMDRDYWVRLALAGGHLAHLPEPVALFRIYDESKTQAGSTRWAEEAHLLNARLFAHPDLPAEIRAQRKRTTSGMHRQCARAYLKSGQYRRAFGEVTQSARRWPAGASDPSLWYLLGLSLLGLLVGETVWRRLRAWLRMLRRRASSEGG